MILLSATKCPSAVSGKHENTFFNRLNINKGNIIVYLNIFDSTLTAFINIWELIACI